MDEMFNKMMAEMGKLTAALTLMTEQIQALKIVVNVVEDAKAPVAEQAEEKPEAKPEPKKAAKKKAEPKPEESKVPETAEPAMTPAQEEFAIAFSADDVRQAIKEVMEKKGTGVAKEIINGVGNAPNVSAIPAEKYEAVMNACLEACK